MCCCVAADTVDFIGKVRRSVENSAKSCRRTDRFKNVQYNYSWRCLCCLCCPLCVAAPFMTAAANAVFTEVQADVQACEEALRKVGQQLKNKPKWWRRRRIRRTVKAGHVIEAQLKQLVETYRVLVCPETQESVVTPELEAAIANALECNIQTARGAKSPVQLLAGKMGWFPANLGCTPADCLGSPRAREGIDRTFVAHDVQRTGLRVVCLGSHHTPCTTNCADVLTHFLAAVWECSHCADPLPLEEMYTKCGEDELGLPLYQCHRGTSAEEGMHGHLNKLFKGGHYGIDTAQVCSEGVSVCVHACHALCV